MAQPSTTATATGSVVPSGVGASAGPVTLSSVSMTVAGSAATIHLPSVADGDVYFLSVK